MARHLRAANCTTCGQPTSAPPLCAACLEHACAALVERMIRQAPPSTPPAPPSAPLTCYTCGQPTSAQDHATVHAQQGTMALTPEQHTAYFDLLGTVHVPSAPAPGLDAQGQPVTCPTCHLWALVNAEVPHDRPIFDMPDVPAPPTSPLAAAAWPAQCAALAASTPTGQEAAAPSLVYTPAQAAALHALPYAAPLPPPCVVCGNWPVRTPGAIYCTVCYSALQARLP